MHGSHPTDRQDRLRRTWIGISLATVAIVLLVTLLLVQPAMPDRVILLTGPEGSAYHDLGKRYAEDLARRGLEADVVVTEGALDNLRRVAESEDTVAFAPSSQDFLREAGVLDSDLVTLGSIGFEPIWLFYRSDLGITRIPDLAGRVVAAEGRGTQGDSVARTLLEINGLTGRVTIETLSGSTATALLDGFAAGTIDAGFLTGISKSSAIEAMLAADGVSFLSFDRAEAYAGLLPGVTHLVAPEGAFDLARNVPPQDTSLLASTTCLVTDRGLHPAVAPVLLVAAENVRENATAFSTSTEFPSAEHVVLPLAASARRYLSQGETGPLRFLPYNTQRWLRHLGLRVLPLLLAVVVLLKGVPAGLRIWSGLRLKSLFKKLAAVEKGHAADEDRSTLLAELDRIDRASARMFVPLSIVHDWVDFRQFVHDMRERISG